MKGLFVGSFNPITLAHEKIALDLIRDNIVNYIYFVPVNSNKMDLVTIENRIEMINLIINDNEEVLDIYKFNCEGLFNYEVLNKIKTKYKITHIIMGSDLFLKIPTFKNYLKILKEFTIIIISRGDDIESLIKDKYSSFNIVFIKKNYKGSSYLAKKNLNNNLYLNKKVLDYIKENKLYI